MSDTFYTSETSRNDGAQIGPRLVVVVVTYNRLETLKEALAHTLAQDPAAVVVVDNSSSDGTEAWLSELAIDDNRVDPIVSGANLGGAGGFHHGVARAMEVHAPDWILLHDDDSWPQRGCLGAFKQKSSSFSDQVGVVAAAVEDTRGNICEMNRPRRNPFRSLVGLLRYAALLEPTDLPDAAYARQAGLCEIDMGTFVGFFVRAEVVKQVGPPRAELFIYGDDYIYTLTIRKQGYRVLFDPGLRFSHDNFATNKGVKIFDPPWRMYYSTRNSVEAFRIGAGMFWRLLVLMRKRTWLRQASSQPDPDAYIHYMYLGLQDGLSGDFSKTLDELDA